MTLYFHFAPILLAPGSVIEPGNFGRIIRLHGANHFLHRREMAYELVRQNLFPLLPSRLDCLFCFPTQQEANLCRAHIRGFADSVLYEVENTALNPHLAHMNAIQHYQLPTFNHNLIVDYWSGQQASTAPQGAIFREVLLPSAVKVLQKV
jgi:hypothetical protein